MHNHWLKENRIKARYRAVNVSSDDLSRFIDGMRHRYIGCNVTIPHKQAVVPFLDHLGDQARRLGAVNTITVGSKDGALHGDNTDVAGFLAPIEKIAAPDSTTRNRARFSAACISGSGGAARAVICGLLDYGVKDVRVLVRRGSKTKMDAFNRWIDTVNGPPSVTDRGNGVVKPGQKIPSNKNTIRVLTMDKAKDALDHADLFVNATPCGMDGYPRLDVDLEGLAQGALVYDLVYAPKNTDLIKRARIAGYATIGGIDMLIAQGQKAFHHWFGFTPDDHIELRQLLDAAIS